MALQKNYMELVESLANVSCSLIVEEICSQKSFYDKQFFWKEMTMIFPKTLNDWIM